MPASSSSSQRLAAVPASHWAMGVAGGSIAGAGTALALRAVRGGLGLRGGSLITVAGGLFGAGVVAALHLWRPDAGPAFPTDPTTPTTEPGAPGPVRPVSIATVNAENLFDTEDGYGSDPILTPAAYEHKLSKLAHAIADDLDLPDVVALQEVENLRVLDDLAGQPQLTAGRYRSVLLPGSDPRGINVGLLVRGDRLDVLGARQENLIDGRRRLFTRPPLVVELGLRPGPGQAADGVDLVVANNHFVSKLGGAESDLRRADQARFLQGVGTMVTAGESAPPLIVAGDLNADEGEPPYTALTQATEGLSLIDATLGIPAHDRYTYVYRGMRQKLDHVLVSDALADGVRAAKIVHINTAATAADIADPGTGRGASDHDFIRVDLALPDR